MDEYDGQVVTATERSQAVIAEDIETAARELRLCWAAGNGEAPAVQRRLDRLYEELRAARARDDNRILVWRAPKPRRSPIHGWLPSELNGGA